MKCLFREPLYVDRRSQIGTDVSIDLNATADHMCHSVLPLNGSLIGIYIQTQAWTTDYLHPRKQIYRTTYERELICCSLLFCVLKSPMEGARTGARDMGPEGDMGLLFA